MSAQIVTSINQAHLACSWKSGDTWLPMVCVGLGPGPLMVMHCWPTCEALIRVQFLNLCSTDVSLSPPFHGNCQWKHWRIPFTEPCCSHPSDLKILVKSKVLKPVVMSMPLSMWKELESFAQQNERYKKKLHAQHLKGGLGSSGSRLEMLPNYKLWGIILFAPGTLIGLCIFCFFAGKGGPRPSLI